ncbi:hypothetical protein EVAR_85309_1 [Eumeta japonica]|uniref:Uncharacterized protein n=1 Tax=Eumeta variegata TaxID=151549 RepID=A0A4C1V7D6_EUMVA|nr:hypothetical protein EVAR_85309_1 [Eumeta japonica]
MAICQRAGDACQGRVHTLLSPRALFEFVARFCGIIDLILRTEATSFLETVHDLLASYLIIRVQKVDVNGMRSSGLVVRIEVPQGSIVAPSKLELKSVKKLKLQTGRREKSKSETRGFETEDGAKIVIKGGTKIRIRIAAGMEYEEIIIESGTRIETGSVSRI